MRGSGMARTRWPLCNENRPLSAIAGAALGGTAATASAPSASVQSNSAIETFSASDGAPSTTGKQRSALTTKCDVSPDEATGAVVSFLSPSAIVTYGLAAIGPVEK